MTDPQFQIQLDRTANVPVSEGLHTFSIASFEEGEGAKGPYWKFNCMCLTPGEEGKQVPMFCSLTPQARWRLEIFLDAIQAPQTGNITADKFVGRKFKGQITHETYEGRPQARIGEMWPVDQGSSEAPSVAPVKVENAKSESPSPTIVPDNKLPKDTTSEEKIPF